MISLPPSPDAVGFFFSPAFVSSARGNYFSLFKFGGCFRASACGAPPCRVRGAQSSSGSGDTPGPRVPLPAHTAGPELSPVLVPGPLPLPGGGAELGQRLAGEKQEATNALCQ